MGLPHQFVEFRLKYQCAVDLFVLFGHCVPDIYTVCPPSFLLVRGALATINTPREVCLKVKPLELCSTLGIRTVHAHSTLLCFFVFSNYLYLCYLHVSSSFSSFCFQEKQAFVSSEKKKKRYLICLHGILKRVFFSSL